MNKKMNEKNNQKNKEEEKQPELRCQVGKICEITGAIHPFWRSSTNPGLGDSVKIFALLLLPHHLLSNMRCFLI